MSLPRLLFSVDIDALVADPAAQCYLGRETCILVQSSWQSMHTCAMKLAVLAAVAGFHTKITWLLADFTLAACAFRSGSFDGRAWGLKPDLVVASKQHSKTSF